jgi:uncharacterized protein (DUF924 family)
MTWVEDVLEFWFGELNESDWWVKKPAVDAQIQARFGQLHQRLATGDEVGNLPDARSTLAAVIVLDQFSRHLNRGKPQAFAADPLARRLARDAVERGLEVNLRLDERLFLYMPFEHSEDRVDQAFAVEKISSLGRHDWTEFALAHQAVIDRFGRFPHRNAVLGRDSTPEESAALQEPMSSF